MGVCKREPAPFRMDGCLWYGSGNNLQLNRSCSVALMISQIIFNYEGGQIIQRLRIDSHRANVGSGNWIRSVKWFWFCGRYKNWGLRKIRWWKIDWFTYIGERALLTIVHVRDGNFALRHVIVVIDVVRQETPICFGPKRKLMVGLLVFKKKMKKQRKEPVNSK